MSEPLAQESVESSRRYVDEQLRSLGDSSSDPIPSRYRRPAQAPHGNVHTEQSPSTPPGPNPYEEKFHSEMAFVSLVLGIFGLVLPLFSTLAIIFGIGGLMQANREHMKGKWMAVLGIILGFLGIILIILAILFGIGMLESFLAKWGGLETLMGEAGKL